MSIADRRRKHLAWCRYLARTQVPTDRWQHRAPGCDDPRPSGVVRAWEALAVKSRSWPWKPCMVGAPGLFLGRSAVMAHDLPPRYETVHLPEEAA